METITKKDFIKKYNGKRFKRIVLKGATIEDIPTIEQELKQACVEQELKLVEKEHMWEIHDERGHTGQSYFKPVMPKTVSGILTFKSTDAVFEVDGKSIRGSLPAAKNIDTNGYTVDYGDLVYRYEVEEAL